MFIIHTFANRSTINNFHKLLQLPLHKSAIRKPNSINFSIYFTNCIAPAPDTAPHQFL